MKQSNWKALVAGACCALLTAHVGAAGKPKVSTRPEVPAPWNQEPDSVFGIKFAEKLQTSTPECPKDRLGIVDLRQIRANGTPCLDSNLYMQTYVTILGTPDLGFSYTVTARTWEQGVGYFRIETHSQNFDSLASVFTSRYGKPTHIESEEVKTKSGATFTNVTMSWHGKNTSIVIDKFSGDINTTAASLMDNGFQASQRKAAQEKAAAGASKL